MKNATIKSCTRCSLHDNQKPVLDNEQEVDVMWVGISAKRVVDVEVDTPLKADTSTGKLIADIEDKCPRVSFYKTNLVKCLPLDDNGKLRYPSLSEFSLCYPNLLLEIEKVKPKLVLLLGGKVADFVMSKIGSKKEKLSYDYKIFQHGSIWYVHIHHPSYISIYKRKEKDVYIKAVRSVIQKVLAL